MRTRLTLYLLLGAMALPRIGSAQGALTPVRARITDEAIARDYATFDSWRERLDTLPASERPLAVYARAKARAWLDFAEEEYTDNERSNLPAQALAEAEALIVGLERGDVTAAAPTLQLDGLTETRSPGFAVLEAEAAKWRTDGTLERRPAMLAVFEVELIRGERRESQAMYCRPLPHRREAERLAQLLRTLPPAPVQTADGSGVESSPAVGAGAPTMDTVAATPSPVDSRVDVDAATSPERATPPSPAVAPPAPAPAPATTTTPVVIRTALPTRVHFAFDRAFLSRRTRVVLDRILVALQADPELVVALQGHTDTRGTVRYNIALGQRRVNAVVAYLLANGIARDRITSIATVGEGDPGPERRGDVTSTARNRRVTLTFMDGDGRSVPGEEQETDLQPERPR